MLRIFIAFVAILISFSDSYSQEINPRFGDCYTAGWSCDFPGTELYKTEYIEYYPGCIIEVEYIIRKCWTNGIRHFRLEMIGWRALNSSECSALYTNLYNNGTINEILVRQVQMKLYKEISLQAFLEQDPKKSPLERPNYYQCTPSMGPINGIPFMQISEVTCMGICEIKGYDDILIHVNPTIENNFRVSQTGRYYWTYVSYKKCNDACCKLEIDFCWDGTKWWRRTNVSNLPNTPGCPLPSNSLESCVPNSWLAARVTAVLSSEMKSCNNTCLESSSLEEVEVD